MPPERSPLARKVQRLRAHPAQRERHVATPPTRVARPRVGVAIVSALRTLLPSIGSISVNDVTPRSSDRTPPPNAGVPRWRSRRKTEPATFPILEPFATRLESLRLQRGFTQRVLAKRAKVRSSPIDCRGTSRGRCSPGQAYRSQISRAPAATAKSDGRRFQQFWQRAGPSGHHPDLHITMTSRV